MSSVLVLIARPGSRAINAAVLTLLAEHGQGAPHWLCDGEACEVEMFPRVAEFLADLRQYPIDTAIVSSEGRRKRLLIADMDSTMIEQECIDELGYVAGVGDEIAGITRRAMRGELDFAAALRARVSLLKGLSATVIDDVLAKRITYMAGGQTLIATMKKYGAYTGLISGGFVQFTSRVAAHLGFDVNAANTLLIENGKLTGEVAEPILGQAAKVEALHRLAALKGLVPQDTIAVGDGANDVAMLMEAGIGVALHAKPHVQESAMIRINHGDLTALLYLQGYRKDQFVMQKTAGA
jgi:phosphoserine phosphatase